MQVSQINIYPIKSTRGISLEQVQVTRRGFSGDRRWMLIDTSNRFITAREFPRLTLVRSAFENDLLRLRAPEHPERTNPGELKLSLVASGSVSRQVEIWGQQVHLSDAGDAAAEWFSCYLEIPCRVVHLADDQHRPVDPNYARAGDEVSLADGFPVLLISEASLTDLNARLEQPVTMQRFRPNLVISAEEAFIEDCWKQLRIGEVEFESAKACPRCIFTTIDPDTAELHSHQEPLRTLGSYRRDSKGGVNFGQNLIPRSLGTIHLGDSVQVLQS